MAGLYSAFAASDIGFTISVPGENEPIAGKLNAKARPRGGIVFEFKKEIHVKVNGEWVLCRLNVKLTGVASESWPGGPREIKDEAIRSG